VLDDNNAPLIQTGIQYPQGGPVTTPVSFVSAIVGGSTADVISATLQPGAVGTFQVTLHLNSGISSNPATTLTIAQDIYVSKVVTFPVLNPGAPSAAASAQQASFRRKRPATDGQKAPSRRPGAAAAH
jgi:hypothetical protein